VQALQLYFFILISKVQVVSFFSRLKIFKIGFSKLIERHATFGPNVHISGNKKPPPLIKCFDMMRNVKRGIMNVYWL
jgi:hypothetical protein